MKPILPQFTLWILLSVSAGYVTAQAPGKGEEKAEGAKTHEAAQVSKSTKSFVLTPAKHLSDAKVVNEKKEKTHHVSLGINVVKPSTAMYSQLPDLPASSGFLLKSVHPGGSAARAGLKSMDLIWKLDDQMLINEAQLMVLLSHHRPGDHVQIRYFRSGKPEVADLILQSWSGPLPFPDVLAMTGKHRSYPMRVISYEDRSASISDQSGTATLTYRNGKPWLHVETAKGEEIFNGVIAESSEVARVPSLWRNRLPILHRSLEESVRLRKLPRVRYVPRRQVKPHVAGSE